jgi:sigma-E factor negative regulatory protein RseB
MTRGALGSGALALSLACTAGSAIAQTAAQDGRAWLHKIYQATQELSYTGTFVYQHDGRSETSRVTRLASPQGDIERLELLTHYQVRLGAMDRVAGRACQRVSLHPRDNYRYGYELCADQATGMLLRSITLSEANLPIEQFTFTQLEVGEVRPEAVAPQHATEAWRVEEASVRPANLEAEGWRVDADLPGFHKIVEVERVLREREPVGQLVYSDGLAAVSVFIEPAGGRRESLRLGAASIGGINIFVREVEDHIVTVVGEAPAASVRRIADHVRYERPK